MGNRYRAEVTFSAGDVPYTLSYSWNAAASFEEASGKTLTAALDELSRQELSAVSARALLWAGLREHHAGISLERAGRLIDELGWKRVLELMNRAFEYYFPKDETGDGADPQTPAPSI
jgi:hypothetical protein